MKKHVIVVGAGMGGLVSALDLAATGFRVTLLERQSEPGGKMHEVTVGGDGVDSGPTVFTMRWVFDSLFKDAGLSLDDCVELVEAEDLARHAWLDGSRLDLYADLERSVASVAEFAGSAEAEAYRQFACQSASVFETLDDTFMRCEKPGPFGLTLSVGLTRLNRLLQTKPFSSLWAELGRVFRDPRLRQLFARYATYCGSSPFESPATLMLIAHAERAGVWMVRGGMQRFAEALLKAAQDRGVETRLDTAVDEIVSERSKVVGVRLQNGETLSSDFVVFNGDVNALSHGLLGASVEKAVPDRRKESRSLSALTWSMKATPRGFPLRYHTVFFGADYRAEFDAIFKRQTVCDEPTLYVCAQDRIEGREPEGAEKLFVLMNAPPRALSESEIDDFEARAFSLLGRHGLGLDIASVERRIPSDFDARFPGSQGAIYGWPTHGAFGTFKRSGSRSSIKGLYFAGGTVHPGPGIPMAALSGRIAAASIRKDA
ncbi:MAG: phytoene desaturase family protein [Woeseiaceae bacterium]|nr:phytoene desaturase family protein [Woeseiaceae bacterium]